MRVVQMSLLPLVRGFVSSRAQLARAPMTRARTIAMAYMASKDVAAPSVRVRFDREHDRVRFYIADDDIVTETSCATAETAGFKENCDYENLHKDTVQGLIRAARTGQPIDDIVFFSQAAYFGLMGMGNEPTVRLNVGGIRLMLPRGLLTKKFTYFESMFGSFVERHAGEVFIDRDARAFCKLLRYAMKPDGLPCSNDLLAEMVYFGYRTPSPLSSAPSLSFSSPLSSYTMIQIPGATEFRAATERKPERVDIEEEWKQITRELDLVYSMVKDRGAKYGDGKKEGRLSVRSHDLEQDQKDELLDRLRALGFEVEWDTCFKRDIVIRW